MNGVAVGGSHIYMYRRYRYAFLGKVKSKYLLGSLNIFGKMGKKPKIANFAQFFISTPEKPNFSCTAP